MVAEIALVVLAGAALALMGWNQWSTTKMVETQTLANETMAREWREATLTLILGWKDSAPSSEASTTDLPESETPLRDVLSLDDMPSHIAEHYQREAQEDAEMERISSLRSSTLPTPSS